LAEDFSGYPQQRFPVGRNAQRNFGVAIIFVIVNYPGCYCNGFRSAIRGEVLHPRVFGGNRPFPVAPRPGPQTERGSYPQAEPGIFRLLFSSGSDTISYFVKKSTLSQSAASSPTLRMKEEISDEIQEIQG
jgi:hypothetical protein